MWATIDRLVVSFTKTGFQVDVSSQACDAFYKHLSKKALVKGYCQRDKKDERITGFT